VKHTTRITAPQVVAEEAAKLRADSDTAALPPALVAANAAHNAEAALAANDAHHQHDPLNAPGARASPTVRLLGKAEILAITGVTFPTIWKWMLARRFPRSRAVGGKSMWLSTEVDAWLAALPLRVLKGDLDGVS
jgi:predicted DNA-binding transcriptional regulator AlpA